MTLSVIIPTYNEADIITDTIKHVRRCGNDIKEVIVADAGSHDETTSKAEAAGAVVVTTRKGRAAQMNTGARRATGNILYFLHADSLPTENFDDKIRDAVNRGYKAGCFQLCFDSDHFLLNLYAWFSRFDIDTFRFGDQSLYVTRSVFYEVGKFREDHLVMEDNEMVRRIKKEHSFAILDDKVKTSARAYMKGGVLRLQLIFVLIVLLYHLGTDQETLLHIRENATS